MSAQWAPQSPGWYDEILSEVIRESTAATISNLMGPFVKHHYKVTAGAVMRALPFMSKVAQELPALFLNWISMERALIYIFKRDRRLLADDENPNIVANCISNHMMCVAKLLRQWKREDEKSISDPKSFLQNEH